MGGKRIMLLALSVVVLFMMVLSCCRAGRIVYVDGPCIILCDTTRWYDNYGSNEFVR